ncbi:MAG TPA: ferrous iron transport protein A [Candidatus Egerieenecus merdigallinarum]|nr:ferrous iron transport protein A [Candidatus Egerieenecus merdigallinarum]
MFTLEDLAPQAHGIISRVHGNGLTLDRLLALGFTPGAEVIRLYSAPFGDPLVFRVRGSTLAIGRAQARQIELRQLNKREKSIAFLPL